MSFEAAVHAKAIQLDHVCLDMCAAAGSGHPTSALSLGHLVTVLLYHSMRWLPEHPRYPGSDRLVLSEGHAVPIIYAALADLGAMVGEGDEARPAVDSGDHLNVMAISPIIGDYGWFRLTTSYASS
ncbi:MAG: hypothetical protein IIA64_10060 [Planctomycetes bacterium]|nr:hypothetical protein [Planctomycetota bacterium]